MIGSSSFPYPLDPQKDGSCDKRKQLFLQEDIT